MAKGKYQEWITPDGLTRLEGFARSGLNDEQIAKKMGIAAGTLYEWEKKYPEIYEALKKGKAPVDDEVENTLLKTALGFEYEEVITDIIEFPDGEQRKHVRKIKKYAPPSNTAQIFWLKNRRPELWRDKQEISGNMQVSGAGNALKEAFDKMRQGLQDE